MHERISAKDRSVCTVLINGTKFVQNGSQLSASPPDSDSICKGIFCTYLTVRGCYGFIASPRSTKVVQRGTGTMLPSSSPTLQHYTVFVYTVVSQESFFLELAVCGWNVCTAFIKLKVPN